MSLLSGGSGDDRLQVGMAVFAIIVSLVVTMLIPYLAPSYNDADTGYTYESIYLEKAEIEAFTGETMTNLSPWKLTGVYTAWAMGDTVNIDPDTGWLYGQEISNYSQAGYNHTTVIGDTSMIYLNPNQKSSTPLAVITPNVAVERQEVDWWAGGIFSELNIFGAIAIATGNSPYHTVTELQDVNSWSFTGYRYEFDPMLKIDYDDPSSGSYTKEAQTDAKLSLVWYKTGNGQGLSTGLILYSNTSNGYIANITLDDIAARYNVSSNYSTKYLMDYDGVQVYLNIRFDPDVMQQSVDLTEAFNEGRWSLAVTALSSDNLLDIKNSNSLSTSVGNIIDTYAQIFTLSLPNVPFLWSMVLWVVCMLPVEIGMIMFLSRFGIVGVLGGILGSGLLFGLGGLI